MTRLNMFGLRGIIADSPLAGPEMSLAGTLIKVTYAARDPSDPTAGREPTETEYACRVLTNRKTEPHGTSAEIYGKQGASNRKDRSATLKIVGGSLPASVTPEQGDYIEVDGERWRISGEVGGTDVGAMFSCPCRLA